MLRVSLIIVRESFSKCFSENWFVSHARVIIMKIMRDRAIRTDRKSKRELTRQLERDGSFNGNYTFTSRFSLAVWPDMRTRIYADEKTDYIKAK